MKASTAFYRDVLGLPLRFESPHWTEFATEGATLALHLADDQASDDPGRSRAGGSRPGLAVADLAEFHRRMIDRGVPCIQQPKDRFGTLIAQYQDPDGLIISVSQQRGTV